MRTRLRHANSNVGTHLRGPVTALLAMLPLGMAAALRAQSAAQSDKRPQAGTYSLLYSFQCTPDGGFPYTGLIRDSSGDLYGTTYTQGEYGYGAVFKVTPSGTESVLHSFAGPPSDGSYPQFGSLTLDGAGNVYGVTPSGGEFGYGTVFKVTATGTESVLYNFTGGSDGREPYGGMARDSSGNLYGTTVDGGNYGYGVVFKLTPGGTESVLHNFDLLSTDGAYPLGNFIRDSSGNLYSTTYEGGASFVGTVFEVTTSGVESLLYSFKGDPVDGAGPYGGGLLRDSSGNLYGVTDAGGANGLGMVFKLTSAGTESVLLNFTGAGGANPFDGLARDASGNLYGTASLGGSGAGCPFQGCGVLFELGATGKETILHDFTLSSSSDGAVPYGGVIRDPSGNLYGTLEDGGAHGCGAVFKYTP
jgi:uncharacterized repeat protein (TIGR03803 family)